MQFLQWIQLLYLLKAELRVFTYIMTSVVMDSCNNDRLRGEHRVEIVFCSEAWCLLALEKSMKIGNKSQEIS